MKADNASISDRTALISKSDQKMALEGRRIDQTASINISLCHEDPVMFEVASRWGRTDLSAWIDPIVVHESVGGLSLGFQQEQQDPVGQPASSVMSGSRSSALKRPRGRPKKSNIPSVRTPQASPV